MSWQSQKETFEKTRCTVESRVKLECEKEHQEQLLLSVIPAYIAAEVSFFLFAFICLIQLFVYLHLEWYIVAFAPNKARFQLETTLQ